MVQKPRAKQKTEKEGKKKQRLTFAIGKVNAAAPDCAHAVACITPDTKVRLTLIPSSRCNLAAASMPDSVAGIFLFFHAWFSPESQRDALGHVMR